MKKNVLTLLAFILIGGLAHAQSYYYISYPPGTGNPGDLNKEVDEVAPGTGGWASVITPNNAAPVYSATQFLPFAFTFNGLPVTQYKVSSSGYLTFDAAATGQPQLLAEALPSANLPDQTISIWGMSAEGPNDAVGSKVFGSAPNRQLWVRFHSMTTPGSAGSFTYWSIVLEESTNNIYIVEQQGNRNGAAYVSPQHSIGIQVDGSTAVMIPGSPSLEHRSGNFISRRDNAYYAFIYGNQPMYDLTPFENLVSRNIKVNEPTTITGKIRNLGSETVTSLTLKYSVDGGPEQTDVISGITIEANGGIYEYSHNVPYTPTTTAENHDIEVWIDNVNGNLDENPSNDLLAFGVFVNDGITTTKRVLIDEGSGAWCQHCPDALPYLIDIKETYGDRAIVASHHDGNATSDKWTNAESDKIHAAYNVGFPYATVDRKLYDDQDEVGLSRGFWPLKFEERLEEPAPVEITITDKSWNQVTREITFTVEANFVDYAEGELRIGAYIIEDNVRGQGQGYDQIISSAYTNDPSHMFYQYANPMVGYIHPDVVLNIPSGAFGSPNSIPDMPAQKGTTYKQTYVYKLPPSVKFNIPSSSDFDPTGEIIGFHKPADISIIGFVVKYNADLNDREVVNAKEEPLYDVANTVENVSNDVFNISKVYPNPASTITSVSFSLPKTTLINVSVVNTMGQTIKNVKNTTYIAGNHQISFDVTDLEAGVYFVKLENESGQSVLKKFVVIR